MPLFEFGPQSLIEIKPTTYSELKLSERGDMQRVLQENIEVLLPSDPRRLMVICDEFGNWEDARRRIDLLCVDSDKNLVVVELKRNDGSHMELQALRYAAMISPMRFEQAVAAHREHQIKCGGDGASAELDLRKFLSDDGEAPIVFSNRVRIVLVAGSFNTEITTAVIWLNSKGLDITCVRMLPHSFNEKVLVNIEQVLPLPEAADYQIAIREKSEQVEAADSAGRDLTRYRLRIGGSEWEDLPKRRLMLHVVSEAVSRGLSPERIQKDAVVWRPTDMFISVEGTVSGHELASLVADRPTRRYFCPDGECLHFGGRTYALTKMWGRRTTEAVDAILAILPAGPLVAYSAMSDE